LIKEAVILCAGRGERLMPLTLEIHKALIPFAGKPLLIRIIENLKNFGIERIYINLYYHADKIQGLLETVKCPEIVTKMEEELMGTGGGIANFKRLIGGDFLLHNCDILHNLELKELMDFHIKEKSFFTMALKKAKTNARIILDGNRVVEIRDVVPEVCLCYTGISVVSRDFLNYLPEGKSNLIDVLRKVIKEQKVMGYVFEKGRFIDIGTWDTLYKGYAFADGLLPEE